MADELDAVITIATPGGDVVLDAAPFDLVAFGAGGRTWRREVVEGRYQHGRALVGAVLATQSLSIHVRIVAATWAEVAAHYEELADAVSQFSYQVTAVVEGETTVYDCEPGDIAMVSGDTLSKFHAMAGMQEYLLTIPYAPNPGGAVTS